MRANNSLLPKEWLDRALTLKAAALAFLSPALVRFPLSLTNQAWTFGIPLHMLVYIKKKIKHSFSLANAYVIKPLSNKNISLTNIS